MKYYLDSNICIYFLKGVCPVLRDRLLACSPDTLLIPSLVKAELLYGAEKSARREENLDRVARFLFPFRIAAFDDAAAEVYAGLRSRLEKQGNPIGPNDMIIAATVLAGDGILVTNNKGEFSRVAGLRLEDWLSSGG